MSTIDKSRLLKQIKAYKDNLITQRRDTELTVQNIFENVMQLSPDLRERLEGDYDYVNDTAETIFPELYKEDHTEEDRTNLNLRYEKWDKFYASLEKLRNEIALAATQALGEANAL